MTLYHPRAHSLALAGLLTLACAAPPATETSAKAVIGLDLAGRDLAVAPGDDFFTYANGGWSAVTEIRPDRSSAGSFLTVLENTEQQLTELLEASLSAAPESPDHQIGDYYSSFLDEATIDALGTEPLSNLLANIEAIDDRVSLSRYLGATLRADVDAFNATDLYTDHLFGLWVAHDLDDPSRYAPFLLQGGLDMPDRAYYLDPSDRMEEIRAMCLAHMTNVLQLVGLSDPEGRATRVFELEQTIAEAHSTRTESGDLEKGNNHWAREEFSTAAPGVVWESFFAAAGLSGQKDFVVWQPSAVTKIASLVDSESLETWRDYLTFHTADHYSDVLPQVFREERFDFHGRVLSGALEPRPRDRQALVATSVALGDAVGKLYVEQFFPPAAKSRIEEMVENIRQAFAQRIDNLEWMDPETKAMAKEKLATLQVSVGYPDQWRDYSTLEVIQGDALGNAMRTERADYRAALERLSRPASRRDWVMTPQTVNAVNLPVMNAMNFPAAILQSPFFDPLRPIAMDYGAIGAVIGHEISHSFDDQGAKFDASGRLANWWTDTDQAHFAATGDQLVAQYDAYQPFPDLAVNGRLTLGENIADLAGLAAAYDAYRMAYDGQSVPEVAGLTGDQQFFLAFAQAWRAKYREPALRQRLVGDGHSPAAYRAATVRNLDAWYQAFGVTAGQEMYLPPNERVRIW